MQARLLSLGGNLKDVQFKCIAETSGSHYPLSAVAGGRTNWKTGGYEQDSQTSFGSAIAGPNSVRFDPSGRLKCLR
ncbi:unnamed protein product [Hermetia illucens]|uniref:Uncharacterized protein n=1 Tax=Hermetia illucens TaxID=343691 RepID=A0A7R8V9H7_HERIL|nr:unnamed protein product [Hermetia illucens]